MSSLRADAIDVAFGGVQALRSFSLDVTAGEIHGLIGPNGAGKTTAINVINGLLRPRAGTLTLDGTIGRTFQTPAVFADLTALENVMTGMYRSTRSGLLGGALLTRSTLREEGAVHRRAEELLERVGFDRAHQNAPAQQLPFALQRKTEVARVLASEPHLLLLDEPTAGLSPEEARAFVHLIRELRTASNLTILLVEHNVRLVFGLCDRVTAMHEGSAIASGSPDVVRRDPLVITSYLGAEAAEVPRAIATPAAASATGPVLTVRGIVSGYAAATVVRDVSFEVCAGEVVAIFGRNGSGKSTLLNTLLGSPRARSGSVTWRGTAIERRPTHEIVRAGIGLVPQEGGILVSQSVDDNLLLGTFGQRLSTAERRERRDEMYARFPRLAERRTLRAGNLSGGERRMLAIARVLIRRPVLLALDEPSIGLAPAIVEELQSVVAALRAGDLSILITEQNVRWVLPIADRAYLIDTGAIVRQGSPTELAEQEALLEQYLGEGARA